MPAVILPSLQSLAVSIDSLEPLDNNPRVGDVDAVAASLKRFGQRKPIVVRSSDRQIIAGNHTWQAAVQLGWSEIAAVIVDDDQATSEAFALADNRTSELGSYDEALLLELVRSVGDADPSLLSDSGWDEQSVEDLVARINPDLPQVPPTDESPEPPINPLTKPGDVWILGDHKVICGDSTDITLYEQLLESKIPRTVFADPPYGIAYKAMRGKKEIANDGSFDEALSVTQQALSLCYKAESFFVCCDWRSISTIAAAMENAAIEPKACIVWDKETRVQNLDRFAKQHEFIIYAGLYGGQKTVGTDVWRFRRDFIPDHPTPKPIELVAQAIETTTDKGDLIYDPFAGSGSTLMACEHTGRQARVIELDPRYVDVICRRWQEHTGSLPILESSGAAQSFIEADNA